MYWNPPYKNMDEQLITIGDIKNNVIPAIEMEINSKFMQNNAMILDTQNNYVSKAEYSCLQYEHKELKRKFEELMEMLSVRGTLTEEDIKEFRDSRKLATHIAEETVTAPNGFIDDDGKVKLNGITVNGL